MKPSYDINTCYLLGVQALEEPSRRRGAADAVALFCSGAKFDFEEHIPTFITVSNTSFASCLGDIGC